MSSNRVGWFEIYVQDMARAKAFYEAVFATTLQKLGEDCGSTNMPEMWAFPGNMTQYGANGMLIRMPGVASGSGGTRIYFTTDDCSVHAKRVVAAGGQIVQEKTAIGLYGFFVLVTDTEGNTIGLHSMN